LRKPRKIKDLDPAASILSAPFQRAEERAENEAEMPRDLAPKPALSAAEGEVERVAAAWQHLPKAVKAGIVAMVSAAVPLGVATSKRRG